MGSNRILVTEKLKISILLNFLHTCELKFDELGLDSTKKTLIFLKLVGPNPVFPDYSFLSINVSI